MRLTVIAALVLLLAGCSGTDAEGNETPGGVHPHYVEFDGVRVMCIWEKSGYAGGLSCDWEGAQR